MHEFLIDNIFAMFDGHNFQRTAGIARDKNCAPFLTDLLLDSYEADFIQRLLKKNGKKLSLSVDTRSAILMMSFQ